jgi:hypothetical protein
MPIVAAHRCAGAATAMNAAMKMNKLRAQTKSNDLVVLTRIVSGFFSLFL